MAIYIAMMGADVQIGESPEGPPRSGRLWSLTDMVQVIEDWKARCAPKLARSASRMMINIGAKNVGRIAERIVANELEVRGFRVSDLNKEGTAANADLLAVSPTQILQIQVKGSANGPKGWWVGYGYFTEQMTSGKEQILIGEERIFNRIRSNFYKADYVILVAVRSPKEYSCIVLPIDVAEQAAQLHLAAFRWPLGKTHLTLEPGPRAKESDPRVTEERKLISCYRDEQGWERLLQSK